MYCIHYVEMDFFSFFLSFFSPNQKRSKLLDKNEIIVYRWLYFSFAAPIFGFRKEKENVIWKIDRYSSWKDSWNNEPSMTSFQNAKSYVNGHNLTISVSIIEMKNGFAWAKDEKKNLFAIGERSMRLYLTLLFRGVKIGFNINFRSRFKWKKNI